MFGQKKLLESSLFVDLNHKNLVKLTCESREILFYPTAFLSFGNVRELVVER